jgi:opacity protein-like surface antigen
MKQVRRLTAFVLAMAAFASQASAQALPWEGRGFVNVNAGMQLMTEDATTTSTTFKLYDETGTLTTAQSMDSQALFLDIGGGIRIAGNFGFGFTYTRLSATGTADVAAEVPSPLYYDQPRTATAAVDDLEHVENGYHFQALWMLPIADTVDIILSGGPTIFSLRQGVVTSPQITEIGPPYTNVNVTVSQTIATGSRIGFNVGADLTYRFANNIGIGAMVRYAASTVSLEPEGSGPIEVKAGGFQFGGGLRIRF